MVELEHTRDLLENMGLKTAAGLLDAQLERSLKAENTYLAFLLELLTLEDTERKRRGEEMRIKLSRLPHRKTLGEFDFDFQPSIDKRQIDELATLAFAARAENVILLGPPGVGKTHLAVGLAMQALKSGLAVYYTNLSQLIADLKKDRSRTVWNAVGGCISDRISSSLTRSATYSLTAQRRSCSSGSCARDMSMGALF